mgnify:CR=1 FL=1
MVHSLRGPTYAALFLVIPNLVLQGFYFWCLLALFVFDVVISIVDFALERESRRLLGGLPSGEYVLHIIIAMLFGGLVTAVCLEADRVRACCCPRCAAAGDGCDGAAGAVFRNSGCDGGAKTVCCTVTRRSQ